MPITVSQASTSQQTGENGEDREGGTRWPHPDLAELRRDDIAFDDCCDLSRVDRIVNTRLMGRGGRGSDATTWETLGARLDSTSRVREPLCVPGRRGLIPLSSQTVARLSLPSID